MRVSQVDTALRQPYRHAHSAHRLVTLASCVPALLKRRRTRLQPRARRNDGERTPTCSWPALPNHCGGRKAYPCPITVERRRRGRHAPRSSRAHTRRSRAAWTWILGHRENLTGVVGWSVMVAEGPSPSALRHARVAPRPATGQVSRTSNQRLSNRISSDVRGLSRPTRSPSCRRAAPPSSNVLPLLSSVTR